MKNMCTIHVQKAGASMVVFIIPFTNQNAMDFHNPYLNIELFIVKNK